MLTDFVQYLGQRRICVVEEIEQGYFVMYIERDPALQVRQEVLRKKAEADHREEVMAVERKEILGLVVVRVLDQAHYKVKALQ